MKKKQYLKAIHALTIEIAKQVGVPGETIQRVGGELPPTDDEEGGI